MMATMMPSTVHSDTRSRGERETFRRLRDDPETRDWIVLHSLDVADHIKTIATEIDFVVIVPSRGVLCLEVKGCSSVRRHQGKWFYGDDPKPDPRGPFKQAATGMHAIRQSLASARPDLSSVPFWSAVLFPYVDFSVRSDEWHSWQVVGAGLFRSRPISQILSSILAEARQFLAGRMSTAWFNPGSGEPSADQCRAIASVLRPEFEFFESPGSRATGLQEELKHYTSEQFEALDAMDENQRVVFTGPAGTGKTFLALEAARRGVASGRRVLLVCYNRLLGKWLQEQTEDLTPSVVCRTLHGHMRAIVGPQRLVRNPTQEYWEKDLPELASIQLLDEDPDKNTFDEIIVDEGQDILENSYLDFLDLSLRGGLASGRWRIFGDFEKQAIFSSRAVKAGKVIGERSGNVPFFSLRCNCRNTPRVVELVHLLGGLQPPYRRVLRQDDGVEPTIRYYATQAEQLELLAESLDQLQSSGYRGRDIIVLSARDQQHCSAAAIDVEPWKSRLQPYDKVGDQGIGYTSIHAFKGMEAPAIVITDIEGVLNDGAEALFYIGVTRALQRLTAIVSSSAREDILSTLLGESQEQHNSAEIRA